MNKNLIYYTRKGFYFLQINSNRIQILRIKSKDTLQLREFLFKELTWNLKVNHNNKNRHTALQTTINPIHWTQQKDETFEIKLT